MTGAVLGLIVGIFLLPVIGGELTGTARGGLLRLITGSVAGGMLSAALLGPTRRLRGSAAGSAAVGAALMLLATGAPLLAVWGSVHAATAGVAAYLAFCAATGAVLGLIARDAERFTGRNQEPAPRIPRPPFWVMLLVELGWLMEALPTRRSRRREHLRREPVPDAWIETIRRNVPLYARLTDQDRRALLAHVNVFLAEKRFEGCGGLDITDEIRVTIAAQACMLLLHTPHGYFPTLRTILVYPQAYVASERERDAGIEHERPTVRLGESWLRGEVVLSWQSVETGAANDQDGQNVVLHEFAHQLDQADGSADGIPEMRRFGAYSAWATLLAHRFGEFRRQVEAGERGVMDAYGATNRAEFFAVATETFFERPIELYREDPELYGGLRDYYGLDPASAAPAPEPAHGEG